MREVTLGVGSEVETRTPARREPQPCRERVSPPPASRCPQTRAGCCKPRDPGRGTLPSSGPGAASLLCLRGVPAFLLGGRPRCLPAAVSAGRRVQALPPGAGAQGGSRLSGQWRGVRGRSRPRLPGPSRSPLFLPHLRGPYPPRPSLSRPPSPVYLARKQLSSWAGRQCGSYFVTTVRERALEPQGVEFGEPLGSENAAGHRAEEEGICVRAEML